MDINAANLDIVFRSVNTAFQAAMTGTPTLYKQIATELPMASRQVTLAFLDRVPQMKKWLGPRIINNAIARSRTITAEPYETTVGLNRYDVIDDQIGLFLSTTMKMVGEAGAKWPDALINDFILNSATTVNGYDGVPFYSTAHPINGGVAGGTPPGASATQSNLSVSTALTWDNYVAKRAEMAAWRGADGAPLMASPTHIMVGPQLEGTARQIVETGFRNIGVDTAPSENTMKGTAQVIVNPWLSSKGATNWWLLDLSKGLKPFIFHQLQAVTMTTMQSPTDANVFMNNEFLFGIDGRGAASESVWWLSLAATSAGAY